MSKKVIFIDDEKSIRDALGQTLEIEDYDVSLFSSAKPVLAELDNHFEGVIISDINMPEIDGITFLKRALAIDPELSIILLTGHGDISMAVEAMRLGAYDFLEKPFSTDNLLDVVKRAGDKRELILENRELRRELEAQSGPGPRILGNNPKIKQLRRILTHIKDAPADVMIHGETGTGKELVARFLHDHSIRHDKPFVAINCGAIPETMIESELFGFESGAFTGAQKKRVGKIAHANGGTLFLDEIESMPMALQIKMLRVLEERKVEPLGTNKCVDLDVRIIAATKENLRIKSDKGEFRDDLYYRLNVVSVEIPPLRERKDDIPMLFQNFVRSASTRYSIEPTAITLEQQQKLLEHDWPGNVRELRNLAERLVLMGDASGFNDGENLHADQTLLSLSERVNQFEFTLVCDALKRHNGRLKEAQEELGLARKTLYDKMKKHNIDKDDFKASH
ncbi:sigma-54-dependent transcriptional regulator [Photobacterium sanguinicancri]|uniref:DNA-binding response regulator n=1 Tax=Photobacterium sanguinicancri TaxID=875932 RepID=A0AAW7Y0B0_9GAMM|nr:sigma-54 dependent transcriptional regulator [Photobacterium sanguinicancri]MDO6541445.1 sigma-54 dependent transcriptional regulator [Photobacterium sanguinicancri]OZS42867.1 DNA-binding response regulator [Photobacterium sanguinicancri]